jgi:hypothetical protein
MCALAQVLAPTVYAPDHGCGAVIIPTVAYGRFG